VEYFPGKFHDARSELSKSRNEHNLIGLETPDGRKILVNQIAGVLARRIVCPLVVGAALERGERLGMIKFGSRVEIYVPLSDGPVTKVRVGQRVKGGLDALVEYGSGRR
jgi:phosphatidylserine decarboxylase